MCFCGPIPEEMSAKINRKKQNRLYLSKVSVGYRKWHQEQK